jgi:hypothetical protein
MSTKISTTPSGIEPATFCFVAQYLNHFATAVPTVLYTISNKLAAVTCLIAEVSAVPGRSVCGTTKCASVYAYKN